MFLRTDSLRQPANPASADLRPRESPTRRIPFRQGRSAEARAAPEDRFRRGSWIIRADFQRSTRKQWPPSRRPADSLWALNPLRSGETDYSRSQNSREPTMQVEDGEIATPVLRAGCAAF